MLGRIRYFAVSIWLLLLVAVTPARGSVGCSERNVAASAIQTTGDVEAFVRCAAAYLVEKGPDEARRAFNEDARWKQGAIYVFVDAVAKSGEEALTFVFPPNPSREGSPWGESIDGFGTDYFFEVYRLLSAVNEGWIYYAFTNPATGKPQPKSSFVIEVDWNGQRAAMGAGIYSGALPGTCPDGEVNAAGLETGPSDAALKDFVRCAAMLVETEGYSAKLELETSSRWSHGSTYVFVMDMLGNQVMSSNRVRVNGNQLHEWGGREGLESTFGTRGILGGWDVIDVADSFGESFIYYRAYNPLTGAKQRKVGLVKRVVAQGVPVLVGSGYYLTREQSSANGSCAENYITANAVRTRTDTRALVQCAAEYLAEHGPEEARRSFVNDARWSDPRHYIFVRMLERGDEPTRLLVFPPDTSREGVPGPSVHPVDTDVFQDYLRELHRITDDFDSGWIHYRFTDWTTGTVEPKSSYFVKVDWEGRPAVLGSGIYERDLPGTCRSAFVNAAAVESDPSNAKLEEFVRCAAMKVEASGFFAGPVLKRDPRWLSGQIYAFVIDPETDVVLFSGNPSSYATSGKIHELFDGRDMVAVTDMFGEVYWYYSFTNPDTGGTGRKISFVKRVVAQGKPLLVGSGYYPE